MKKHIYDKVEWHYPEGEGCPDLKTAMIHIKTVLDWLNNHGMLTSIGKEIYNIGVDSETSITSDMITDTGNRVMKRCYNKILIKFKYGVPPSLRCFNEYLQREKGEL